MPVARRARDLVDSIGVNTHMSHGPEFGTQYFDGQRVLDSIRYLGVRYARESNPVADDQRARFYTVMDGGVSFDLLPRGANLVSPQQLVTECAALEARRTGSIHAIEGPNEPDHNNVNFGGASGTQGALNYQQALFDAVNANPTVRDKTVYDFSWAEGPPTTGGAADIKNLHFYCAYGKNPQDGELTWALPYIQARRTDLGIVWTETGYFTTNNGDTRWSGVSFNVQARNLLNCIMRGQWSGIARTYIYQLFNQGTGSEGREAHFGLFDHSFQPKTAANAIRNFTSIVDDAAANASTFSAGTLNYTVSGTAPYLAHMLYQKADGTYVVIVWAEPWIWNPDTFSQVDPPSNNITVNLGQNFPSVRVYDPMAGTSATQTLSGVSAVTVTITDHPIVIQASGQTTAPPASAATIAYNRGVEALVSGAINLGAVSVRAMLTTSSYTADKALHQFRSSVTNEVATGAGYAPGGVATSAAVSRDDANNKILLTMAPVSWTAPAGQTLIGRNVVYYVSTGNAATDRLIAAKDFGSDQSASGRALNVAAVVLEFQN